MPPVSQSVIDTIINRIDGARQAAGDARISTVFAPSELPAEILAEAKAQGISENEIHGVLHKGHAHIVRQNLKSEQDVEEVLAHEILGHGGVNALLGSGKKGVLLESFNRAGGLMGVRAIAKRMGVLDELNQRVPGGELNDAKKVAIVDEMLALAQGKQGKLRQVALEWLGKIRNLLIAALDKAGLHGMAARLDKFDATEAATMLRQMREAVIQGGNISGDGVAFMTAWHGGQHDFDKFDSSKIGMGTGLQVYGHGLYFGSAREIGEHYRDKAIKESGKGKLYQVELAPTEAELLDWDKPLGEQSDTVKSALEAMLPAAEIKRLDGEWRSITGEDLYTRLSANATKDNPRMGFGDGDKYASQQLHAAGVRGIRYLDGASRFTKKEPTHNYVIFDDADVSITAKYSRRIHGERPSVQDYIVPETPEFDGNMNGDLAYTPRSAIEKGIDQLPIRLSVGEARAAHRGFGIVHMKAEGDTIKSRRPPEYTADDAENYARHVAVIAKSFSEIYKDGNKIVLRSARLKESLIVERRNDGMTGEEFYSVVSLRPSENVVWGAPVWFTGRAALPGDRLPQSRASEPSPGQESQQPDRQVQRNQTSHFDLTQERADRQQKKQPTVTIKKRRAFSMREAMDQGNGVSAPHTIATLKDAINSAFPKVKKLADALLGTGKVRIITADQLPEGMRGAKYSKVHDVDGIKIIENPTREQAINLAARSEFNEIRGIIDPDSSSIFIFPAMDMLHGEAAAKLGLDYGKIQRTGGAFVVGQQDIASGYRMGLFSGERMTNSPMNDRHPEIYYSRAESNGLQSEYEVPNPSGQPRSTPLDGATLRALRRAAAGIESPHKGITFLIADDGRAIVSGPKGAKVPARFQRFANDNSLTLVVRRGPSDGYAKDIAGAARDTFNYKGKPQYSEHQFGAAMPLEYREAGALYFGELGDARLDRTGKTRFSVDAQTDSAGRVLAYVQDGQITFVADNIDQNRDSVKGLLLHELGVHALQAGRNDAGFQSLLKTFEGMKASNAKVQAAFNRVPKDTQAHLITEEALGYYVERHPEQPLAKRVIAWVKAYIRKLADGVKGADKLRFVQWANTLTDADILYMVTAATRRAPETLAQANRAGTFMAENDAAAQARESYLATERAYGGKEAYRRAKDAGKTKLNYQQWVQVRTPEFKAWFGDWELSARPLRQASTFSEAREKAKDFQGKRLTSSDGVTAIVSRSNLDKMLSASSVHKSESASEHSLAVANLDSLFAQAVTGWVKADRDGDTNIAGIRRMFAPMHVDGKARLVKMTVKEFAGEQGNRIYSVEAVAVENEISPVPEMVDADRTNGSRLLTGPTGLIDSLVQRIQDFNKNGASKVVDPDTGEPMVVYHGTDKDFTEFSGEAERLPWNADGAGHYFSSEAGFASGFGGTVMPVFLNLKNPKPSENFEHTNVTKKHIETFAAQGVDGIHFDGEYITESGREHKGRDEWVSFDPTQIKSATGNIGAFNSGNPDIRYSRASDTFETPEPSRLDNLIYTLQDKHIDLKRVVESIKATGKQIGDDINAYLQEELFHGRTAKRTKNFTDHELQPLMEEMAKTDVPMADFEEYLWMRHAEERNAQIAKVNPDMPDGGSGVDTAEALGAEAFSRLCEWAGGWDDQQSGIYRHATTRAGEGCRKTLPLSRRLPMKRNFSVIRPIPMAEALYPPPHHHLRKPQISNAPLLSNATGQEHRPGHFAGFFVVVALTARRIANDIANSGIRNGKWKPERSATTGDMRYVRARGGRS